MSKFVDSNVDTKSDDRLVGIECTLEGSCTRRYVKENHAKETKCWSVGLDLVTRKSTACAETLHRRNLFGPNAFGGKAGVIACKLISISSPENPSITF